MANGVLLTSLVDVINNTLPHMPRGKWEETLAITNHAFTKLIFGPRRMGISHGKEHQTRIRLRDNNTFAWSNLYGGMAPRKNFVSGIIGTPWAHFLSRGIVFDKREQAVNSGPEAIVKAIEMERSAEYADIWLQLERAMISAGKSLTPAADDPPSLRGIPYHLRLCIQANNTPVADSAGGFDGMVARFEDGSYTTVRGSGSDAQVDTATVENKRARNYCFTIPAGVWNDAIEERVALAMENTNFEGDVPQLKGENKGTTGPTVIWVSTARKLAYEAYVNKGPDDRNGDSRPYSGGLTFRDAPVRKAAILDQWDIDPIIGLRSRYIDGIVFDGRWMTEAGAIQDPFAHNVVSVPIDGSCNVHCANPQQAGWIGHEPLAA